MTDKNKVKNNKYEAMIVFNTIIVLSYLLMLCIFSSIKIRVDEKPGDWTGIMCVNKDVIYHPENNYHSFSKCYDVDYCEEPQCSSTWDVVPTFCCRNTYTMCSVEFKGTFKVSYMQICVNEYGSGTRPIHNTSTKKIVVKTGQKAWYNSKYQSDFMHHLVYEDPIQSNFDKHLKILNWIFALILAVMNALIYFCD